MTPEQVKQKFRNEGKSFADFARENNLATYEVYRVLNGQYKGYRGKAHNIAVLLGLKAEVHKKAA